MPVSEVSICNQALSWLGGTLITSLKDETTEGELCQANYANLRDAVLEERAWTFATFREELTPLRNEPEWGGKTLFQLPGDNIRVLTVYSNESDTWDVPTRKEWFIEGEHLIIDQDVVRIRYIRRITAPGRFSPSFVQALAARLAADLALPLTQSARMKQDMWALFQAKLTSAGSLDGMQGTREKKRSDALRRVRR